MTYLVWPSQGLTHLATSLRHDLPGLAQPDTPGSLPLPLPLVPTLDFDSAHGPTPALGPHSTPALGPHSTPAPGPHSTPPLACGGAVPCSYVTSSVPLLLAGGAPSTLRQPGACRAWRTRWRGPRASTRTRPGAARRQMGRYVECGTEGGGRCVSRWAAYGMKGAYRHEEVQFVWRGCMVRWGAVWRGYTMTVGAGCIR